MSSHNLTRRHRLEGFDYHTPGFYFLTICQHDRQHLFGTVSDSRLTHTAAGIMICHEVEAIDRFAGYSQVDAFIVMPNHVHLLIALNMDEASHRNPDSIILIMNWWKTQTTNKYIKNVKALGWPRFRESLWQEGYHDRIIRNERELEIVRSYIRENPARWEDDTFFDH